ncbi:MAG TPA: hypothetical protein VN154_13585 [Rhizomicrobium sp.]|nr:hypothetical protein [Rhizomicrobium sp.]
MRFARISNALAVTLALLTLGCAGGVGGAWDLGRARYDADPPSDKESYIVLGVQPEYTQVSLFPGRISDGVFHQDMLSPAEFAGQPQDGFVVTRASAQNVLAITYVVMFTSKNDTFRPLMVPCGGAKTLVITVPAGKVIYIGSVRSNTFLAGRCLSSVVISIPQKST